MKEKHPVSRRNFLQKSTIAISAPAVLGLSSSLLGKEPAEVKFAVIGTGGRGRHLLGEALKVPGTRVTALCDIDPDALDQALKASSSHKPKTYSNYRKLLDQKDIEAIIVATPPYLHKAIIIDVLASGRHCYAEKPMALTVHDLDAVVETAGSSKGILQIGQQLRYHKQFRQLMPRIHNGELGKIGFIRGQRYGDWNGPGSRGAMKWLWTIEESGDQIVEQSVHELDVLNWIMNDHPIRIAGLGGQNIIHEPEGANVFDTYGLTLEYPQERHAVFSMIKYAPYSHNMGGRIINAYGEKGSVDVQLSDPCTIVWRGKDAPPAEKVHTPEVNFGHECMKDFFRCIREGDKPFCDAQIGRVTALTALLGRKAMYERRVVTWEDLLREGAPVKPIKV
jgi:myo-inositol 2-dehydrogenase/D-chiro-inositol 1-dehydrogenase